MTSRCYSNQLNQQFGALQNWMSRKSLSPAFSLIMFQFSGRCSSFMHLKHKIACNVILTLQSHIHNHAYFLLKAQLAFFALLVRFRFLSYTFAHICMRCWCIEVNVLACRAFLSESKHLQCREKLRKVSCYPNNGTCPVGWQRQVTSNQCSVT